MMWQALVYGGIIAVLITASYDGDRIIREIMIINAAKGSHPKRIEMVLKVKKVQKVLDRVAAFLAMFGLWHVATLAGLL